MDNITIVCFGDSLTFGYCVDKNVIFSNRLNNDLPKIFPEKTFTVINSGVNGDTSRDALARVPSDVITYSPDIVTVLLGTNDCAFSDFSHVSSSEYRQNMIKIINTIKSTGAEVIVISPPPVNDDEAMPFCSDECVSKNRKISEEIALEFNCSFIDFYSAAFKKTNGDINTILQDDGVHINELGYRIIYDEVLEIVKYIVNSKL